MSVNYSNAFVEFCADTFCRSTISSLQNRDYLLDVDLQTRIRRRHTYNARSETAAEKPSYRAAWRNRQHGLVFVDNFYEPCYETSKAVRTQIRLKSEEPFAIACLWDRWKQQETGEIVTSFSMLTMNADQHPVMKRFHRDGDEKRTPVIVPEPNYMD